MGLQTVLLVVVATALCVIAKTTVKPNVYSKFAV